MIGFFVKERLFSFPFFFNFVCIFLGLIYNTCYTPLKRFICECICIMFSSTVIGEGGTSSVLSPYGHTEREKNVRQILWSMCHQNWLWITIYIIHMTLDSWHGNQKCLYVCIAKCVVTMFYIWLRICIE